METIFQEVKRVRKSRERLFSHCINLLGVIALDLEKEPKEKSYKRDLYNLTIKAIETDEKEMREMEHQG